MDNELSITEGGRFFKCEEVYQKLLKEKKLSEKHEKLLSKLSLMRTQIRPILVIENPYSSHGLYFDWDGSEIKLWEWVFKTEFMKKHVAKDTIDGRFISTVWLGLNHGWDGAILIFETMIFFTAETEEGFPNEDYQDRYSTYEAALEGHKKACEWVKNGNR